MKSLSQYIANECGDGAATPGSTIGMGNPMMPGADGDDSTVGSGDLLTAKAKKEKKKIKEGLLDIDLDVKDEVVVTNLAKTWAEKLSDFTVNFTEINNDKHYIEFLNDLQEQIKTVAITPKKSIMAALRSKDYTVILFKQKVLSRRFGVGTNAVEIRKFIQNPLPESVTFYVDKYKQVTCKYNKRANHLVMIDIKNTQLFFLPADVYDDMFKIITQKVGIK